MMKNKSELLLGIYKDISLTEEEFKNVASKFELITLDKGERLIKVGDTVYHQYYVYDGCLRSYLLDNVGKEHTLQFAVKDWWISDYIAYFSSSSAIMSIECIQKSTVLKVSRKSMEQLYLQVPKIATYNRAKLEKAYVYLQMRVLKKLSTTAKERYISFINTYPNIEQIVKNYHIASYLGIATESLSRIRKEIADQKLN
jgi:CRP-like cAMP-binding protein